MSATHVVARESSKADCFGPLTPDQLREMREAKERAGSFLGAAKVAAFNVWTLGFFAFVSILFGLLSPINLAVGVGLAMVSRNEFIGRSRLRKLDASGLELMWRNQLGLLALVTAYCLWNMYRAAAHPDPQMSQLTELLGAGSGELVRSLTLTVYAAMILAAVIFQGLNARYYFVRVERLREHLRRTPPWVLELQRLSEV